MAADPGKLAAAILCLITLSGCGNAGAPAPASELPSAPATLGAALDSGAALDFGAALDLAALPRPAELRTPAAAFDDEVLGKDYLQCSSNALPEDNYLRLNSPLNGIAWGVWRFSPGPRTLASVEAVLSVEDGDEVYFALPDYASNVWRFVGPLQGGDVLALNNSKHKSPAGGFCVGVITASGNAAVVHKLILCTEHPWAVTTVDSVGAVGTATSLAEVEGTAAISYCASWSEASEPGVRYIHAVDALATEWAAPKVAASGMEDYSHTSLEVVNGRPAISFQGIMNFPAIDAGGYLYYVWATDSAGTFWGTPKYLDGDPLNHDYLGGYNSLAVVDGVPAISYRSEMYASLMFIKAQDASGGDWNPPQTLDDSENVGWYTSLVAPSGGQPMISYFDAAGGDLKGIGMNAAGTAWNPPFFIDGSSDDVGLYASGALVYDDLAVCYYNSTQEDLRLARYNMIAGNWVNVVVTESGPVTSISLAVIGGNPAVAYHDETNEDLKYVRALDAGGQNWGAVETVDSLGATGLCPSLAEIGGKAAISYTFEYHDLRFALRVGP